MEYIVENGSIFYDKHMIESPAFLADRVTGTVHRIGDIQAVRETYELAVQRDTNKMITEDWVIFQFKESEIPVEKIADEMNKLLNISGYSKKFLLSQGIRE